MASTMNKAWMKSWSDSIKMLAKAKGGRFAGKTQVESLTGSETRFFETLGSLAAATAASGNNVDTPLMDIAQEVRALTPIDYNAGTMISRVDAAKVDINFESSYVKRVVESLMRKRDIETIKGMMKTVVTGKDLAGTAAFDYTNNTIPVGATGMNIAKLLEVRSKFWAYGYADEEICIALTGKQIADLLAEEEVGNFDYNSVKALVKGELDQYLGISIVQSEYLPFVATDGSAELTWNATTDAPVDTDATSTRGCIAWIKDCVIVGTNPEIYTAIDQRADKRNNWQCYAEAGVGAIRLEETGVLWLPCLEA